MKLFGRDYKQGMTVEYAPNVPRRGNLPGAGGLAGVTESLLLGTVEMVYELTMTGRGPSACVLVEITQVPIIDRVRGFYIVNKSLARPPVGHSHLYKPNNSLIHVDSITHRVMMVQHFNPAERNEHMCAIPMWLSR